VTWITLGRGWIRRSIEALTGQILPVGLEYSAIGPDLQFLVDELLLTGTA
jgi:hypothetical protein